MIELDHCLSAFTRRYGKAPGMHRVRRLLRRIYARRYRNSPNAETVIPDFDGDLKMRVDRAGTSGSRIYWDGSNAKGEIRVLRGLLQPDMVFVDVGAHQGEFTLVAAHRLRGGTVLAFEPVPGIFSGLRENVEMNGFSNVRLYNIGLGSRPGEFEMFLDAQAVSGDYRDDRQASLYRGSTGGVSLGKVRIARFDDIFAETGLDRLDLVKIDVEGAELAVLQGARDSLERHRPTLMMEMNALTARAAGHGPEEVPDLLSDLGYRLHRIHKGQTRPIETARLPAFANVLCLPE